MAEGGFDPEEIPLLENQDQDQNELEEDRQETPFIDDDYYGNPDSKVGKIFIGSEEDKKSLAKSRQTLTEDIMNEFYDEIEYYTGYTPTIRDKNIFNLDSKGRLYVKFEGQKVLLTHVKNNSEFLKFSTILRYKGVDFIRRGLGFNDYDTKTKQARSKLIKIKPKQIESKKLPEAADQVSKIIEGLTHDVDVQTEGLNYRELNALDKSLQTVKGELILNQGKLDQLDAKIQQVKAELEEATSEEERTELQEQLNNLQDERRGRLEVINRNTDRLRSQINRIKETITTVMDSDLTLRERINILFREQGITIASILTAIGLAISTIVSSIVASVRAVGTGGAIKPTPEPAPKPTLAPPSKGGVTDWIKRQLWNLANVLKKLGLSALGALPGIIGSILSWIFNVASKAVGWVAEHVWTLFVGAGVLLLTYVQKNG